MTSDKRRTVLKAGAAGALALGFPAIVRSQSDKIKIGHLTPLTGFLGALGEYAVMGIKMADGGDQRSRRRHGAPARRDVGGLGQSGHGRDQGAAHARARRRRRC